MGNTGRSAKPREEGAPDSGGWGVLEAGSWVLKDTLMSAGWPRSAVGGALEAFRQSPQGRSQRHEIGLESCTSAGVEHSSHSKEQM